MANSSTKIAAIIVSLAFASPSKSEDGVEGEAFLEYVRIHSMIAGNEGRYVMRWLVDGRVELRLPPHALNAGHHMLKPGEYDIDTLENVISRTEQAQWALQDIDVHRSLARSGQVHQVHDADVVLIRTHPSSRSPVNLRIQAPDHWAGIMPENQALAEMADLDQVLMNWIENHAAAARYGSLINAYGRRDFSYSKN